MSMYDHAMLEFRAAGWVDETNNWTDDMQQAICEGVLRLINQFSKEGHSGSTAPYSINLFKQLASFEPIVPLTGEDWEWTDVADHSDGPLWQNKRCGHVFKDVNGAYDIDGIVFYDWYTDNDTGEKYKAYYTSRDSRVPVTFPYTPTTEYRETVTSDD